MLTAPAEGVKPYGKAWEARLPALGGGTSSGGELD